MSETFFKRWAQISMGGLVCLLFAFLFFVYSR